MRYNYKCGDEVIRVFWNDDNSVTVEESNKSYRRTIRQNENGKFFTWNHNKIYLEIGLGLPCES